MSQQPASRPDRQPLDEHAAAAIRAYAADQRAKVDILASVLEDIAAHGHPSPETGVLWEEARDAHLQRSPTAAPVSPEHAPRRSQVVLVEPALSRLSKLTAAETHRLDRAIVAVSAPV